MVKHKNKDKKLEQLSKSLEKYIYTIYKLQKENIEITPKIIGEKLGYNKASTSEGLRALKKRELIEYFPYREVTLTDIGEKYAKNIEKRRKTISLFLEKFLLLQDEELEEGVNSIEYGISENLENKMTSFLEFLEFCPNNAPKWLSDFKNYLTTGEIGENCSNCLEESLINGKCKECKF